MSKSKNPEKRMGVYKRLDDVPDHHRLQQYSSTYEGYDMWKEFLSECLFERYDSERFKEDARRAGERWKAHVEARGRHHALATPEDVETWCQKLLDRLKIKTAYNSYWIRIERFYTWLQWHREHPHTYQPVLMAAANGGAAGEIWDEKIRRGRGVSTE